jgi:hypothetical protein
MPRRTPPRGPGTTTPVDDVLRAHGVVLEDIRSRMEMVVEAVTVTRTELKADLHALDSRLSERISILEGAVRENSRDIRKNSEEIRKNSEDICTLREQVAGLRHDFDHREEIGRLTGLEARVTAIETRLATRT